MQRRHFLLLAAACMPLALRAAPPASANALSLPAAINRAGRLRMLSQRTAKAWLMQAEAVLPDKAKSILEQSVRSVDHLLAELKAWQPNEDVRLAWQQCEAEWSRYRSALLDSRSDGKVIWSGSDNFLTAAQQLTLAYERSGSGQTGKMVNLAGRQRMLSQRMAKAFFCERMGINAPQAKTMLEGAIKEFAKALEEMRASPLNTVQIGTELALVEQQWFFFQNALTRQSADRKKALAEVASTSERILDEMDAIANLYEKLSG